MRPFLFAAALALPLPAMAETISQELGRAGLAATESRLAALATATDADKFALGGIRFLRALETTLQIRWQAGLNERFTMIPLLRVPVPENPNPTPPGPGIIADLFRGVAIHMDAARAPLADIQATSDFALDLALADLWFDINANAVRDAGEDLTSVLGPMIFGWDWDARDPATPVPVVRFDAADAMWLSAYTHLLGGISELILAYDPTEPITRVLSARAAMAELGAVISDPFMGGDGVPDSLDIIAVVLETLNQQPDAARMAAAQAHFLAMIADNRAFWVRVAAETDNAAEWLPNDAQQSAMGIPLPPGTGVAWMAVLSDLESVVKGDKLVPYWRLDGAGVNVGRMFTDPRPIDLAGWVQGWAALPYLERGAIIDTASVEAFDRMMSGQAMLMSLFLN